MRESNDGPMEPTRHGTPHYCERDLECVTLSKNNPKPSYSSDNLDTFRQPCSSVNNKQTRICKVDAPTQCSLETGPPSNRNSLFSEGTIHSRNSQCMGRPAIPLGTPTRGMVSRKTLFQQSSTQIRSMGDRSLCTSGELSVEEFRLQVPSPRGSSNRLLNGELEPVEVNLPIPSTNATTTSDTETRRLQGHRAAYLSETRIRSLVACTSEKSFSSRRRLRHRSVNTTRVGVLKLKKVCSLSRLDFLKFILTPKYGKIVTLRLTKAVRLSTNNQYEHCWKIFQQWLVKHKVQILVERTVLKFLVYLVEERNLSPQTTRVYKNSLRLPLWYGFSIDSSSEPFKLLLQQQFIAKPPVRRIIPYWSLKKVLSLLEMPYYQNSTTSPHRLLVKTLFLLALASASRVSELAAFDRENIVFSPDYKKVTIAVRPGFVYKNERVGKVAENISFSALMGTNNKPHSLCPIDALRSWLHLTRLSKERALFLHTTSKKPLRSSQLSHIICATINSADPGKFPKAHDVRKVGVSVAWTRGLKVSSIIQKAFWSSSNVFINRYLHSKRVDNLQCVALDTTL